MSKLEITPADCTIIGVNRSVNIAIDAMGGDHAPEQIVVGALEAARDDNYRIILVGDEARIRPLMEGHPAAAAVEIVHTPEYITMDESPSLALKKKKQASLVVAARLIREGRAQGMVSAGNTGAVTHGAIVNIGRISGIKRPALATFWPGRSAINLMLDSGANADCRPEFLQQFALMGSIYACSVAGIEKPRVALLNIGEEVGKGNTLVMAAYKLLEESPINFIGNLEMGGFLNGKAEVAVCDGFVGNMVLKSGEAAAELLFGYMKEEIGKSPLAALGAMLSRKALRRVKSRLDHSVVGGALLLGLEGICVKSHGRADSTTIVNAIKMAGQAISQNMIGRIAESISGLIGESEPEPDPL